MNGNPALLSLGRGLIHDDDEIDIVFLRLRSFKKATAFVNYPAIQTAVTLTLWL
jgi:hypothetical protein